MEMEVLSDLSTEKLTLLPGKFLSFCDSTLTPKDLLLRARKQQILLTDLITTSSAMGFDSCGGRDLFSPTKPAENCHCYGTQSTHLPWVGFGIPVSQTIPMVKQKIAYCLRSQQITNANWHLSDLATRLWTYFNCWPRGKILFVTSLTFKVQKDAHSLAKKQKHIVKASSDIWWQLENTRGEWSKIPVS